MISYLSGKVLLKKEKFVVIDVRGVGYKVFLASSKINFIQEKKDVSLYCAVRIKKDYWELYGFSTLGELEFFEFLMTIPGVGPKAGLEISSLGSLDKFKKAVEKEDEKVLKKLFSLGKKKAQSIIFEISRKIKTTEKKGQQENDEVIHSLSKLGFSKKEIKEVIKNIDSEILKTEDKIKAALKILGK